MLLELFLVGAVFVAAGGTYLLLARKEK